MKLSHFCTDALLHLLAYSLLLGHPKIPVTSAMMAVKSNQLLPKMLFKQVKKARLWARAEGGE